MADYEIFDLGFSMGAQQAFHWGALFPGVVRAIAPICGTAKTSPHNTNLYFRARDNELEVAQMPNAELRPIPSTWGHAAGRGTIPVDNAFIDTALRELLE